MVLLGKSGKNSENRISNYVNKKQNSFLKKCFKQKLLILLALPAFLIVLVFSYLPMYGLVIAFKDFHITDTIWGSKWVGLKWFAMFFGNIATSLRLSRNTLLLGGYGLLWMFFAAVVFSLLLNEITRPRFKKVVQSISYMPYFISTVILVGLIRNFSSHQGLFNQIIGLVGLQPVMFLQEPGYFRTLFIGSGLWQGLGMGTIIYMAALTNIDTELYEAAYIDGANRFKRVIHIVLPAIIPTMTIMFILGVGGILNSDTQKILLMYNPLTYETADTLGTYVYREGLASYRYSYGSAVDLVTNIVSFIFVFSANKIAQKLSETSLW